MIYLISQIILALAVAIILGIAVGWLVHRSLHNKQSLRFRQEIKRQGIHLAQAQSDVSMLSEDYNELQSRTKIQIDTLRQENDQIPELSNNLEKSQLLVRQMMQRHEAKVRDLLNENQNLTSSLASYKEQEQIKNQLEAELDNRRRQDKNAENDDATTLHVESAASDPSELVPIDVATDSSASIDLPASTPLYAAAESDEDPFDEVMEVGGEMLRELELTDEQKAASLNLQDYATALDNTDTGQNRQSDVKRNHTQALPGTDKSSPWKKHPNLSIGSPTDSSPQLDTYADTLEEIGDVSATDTLSNLQAVDILSTFDETSDDIKYLTGSEDQWKLAEFDDDGTLFEPVTQHDDLQQIFGIGPLTEKALNELGITSYSQLAELKEHDVQKIADALEIGPGRIERDNWVGNARRQLEEVLEQL